jgi:hypothetical protein
MGKSYTFGIFTDTHNISIQKTIYAKYYKFIDKESQNKIIKPCKFDEGSTETTANLCNYETLKFLKFKPDDLD